MQNVQRKPRLAAAGGNNRFATAAIAGLLAAGAACGPALAQNAPAAPESMTDKLKNLFGAGSAKPGADNAPPAEGQPPCPIVDVRQGASTITVYGPGEQAATNVRYQATVGQMARECEFAGPTMRIKVGMQGRVILGPVATPGKLDLPLRIALVHEGPEPKTLWTKLYRVPIAIAAGQPNVPFVHVEQDVSVPKPSATDAESYVVYVGFDQIGVKDEKGKKPKTAKGAKPPKEAVNAEAR